MTTVRRSSTRRAYQQPRSGMREPPTVRAAGRDSHRSGTARAHEAPPPEAVRSFYTDDPASAESGPWKGPPIARLVFSTRHGSSAR